MDRPYMQNHKRRCKWSKEQYVLVKKLAHDGHVSSNFFSQHLLCHNQSRPYLCMCIICIISSLLFVITFMFPWCFTGKNNRRRKEHWPQQEYRPGEFSLNIFSPPRIHLKGDGIMKLSILLSRKILFNPNWAANVVHTGTTTSEICMASENGIESSFQGTTDNCCKYICSN